MPDFSRIDAISFDVDGVLTDGRITYTDAGHEIKSFHVQDGAAFKQLMRAGIHVALITGRSSSTVTRRAVELGIDYVYQGTSEKVAAFREFLAGSGVPAERAAHVGDDLADLDVFGHCGLGIAVPNAHPELLRRAGYVTTLEGGRGVVRELAELILRAKDAWPYP